MNPVAEEWIVKAEGDYASALREFRARKNPNYDSARYPGESATRGEAKQAVQAATRLRQQFQSVLKTNRTE